MQIRELEQKALQDSLSFLAKLRAEIFKEYPYLYEASEEAEKSYLQKYSKSPDSSIVALYEEEKIVGMASGLPLSDAPKEAWEGADLASIESIYYLGDLLLKKPYRKKGYGSDLYRHFEKVVLGKKRYLKIAFKEVVREPPDFQKPPGFLPLDVFWIKRGFIKHPDKKCHIQWKEIDGQVKSHTLVFWIKDLMPSIESKA